MKRWIIIPRNSGLLLLVMLILFALDMAKPGIGQFALIPSLKQSAQTRIPQIPTPRIIPTLPQPETPQPEDNQPPQLPPPPQRADCTAIESYANQCTQL